MSTVIKLDLKRIVLENKHTLTVASTIEMEKKTLREEHAILTDMKIVL